MKTEEIIMLAAVGIGAYFLLVRKSSARGSMARYDMGPATGPRFTNQEPRPTNANYVDLASAALNAFSEWNTKSTTVEMPYVPDFSADNIGATQRDAYDLINGYV